MDYITSIAGVECLRTRTGANVPRAGMSGIHPLAQIHQSVKLGKGVKVWQFADVQADLGDYCVVGHGSQINRGARIGNYVRINSLVIVCKNVTLEDHVHIAGGAVLLEDSYPDPVASGGTSDRNYRKPANEILVKRGAAIGVNATILPGVTIGERALVGAGSVVTRDVRAGQIVAGNPARAIVHGKERRGSDTLEVAIAKREAELGPKPEEPWAEL